MSNKERHAEIMKRLDLLEQRLAELLKVFNALPIAYPGTLQYNQSQDDQPRHRQNPLAEQIYGPPVPPERMREAARKAWGLPVSDQPTQPPAAE